MRKSDEERVRVEVTKKIGPHNGGGLSKKREPENGRGKSSRGDTQEESDLHLKKRGGISNFITVRGGGEGLTGESCVKQVTY